MAGLSRRKLLRTAGMAAPVLAFPFISRAASFPDHDIAFIIPDAPGGGFDSAVRAIAPALEKYLPNKVNVVPTNVVGGGGNRAATQLYRAKPDGLSLGIFNIPGLFIAQQQGESGYDLAKLTWLGRVGEDVYALGVGANSPLKSIADLKALSQTRPVKFTSTGQAGTAYAATQIATNLLGIKAQIITGYKGSSEYALAAIRGDGDAVITTLPLLQRLRAGGDLRILASFEKKSTVPGADDATTLKQPELALITLERLIAGPPGLPAAIKATLSDALWKALADPQIVDWAKKAEFNLARETPDQAAATLADQEKFFAKWKRVLTAG
jgi:tripartite-type tricarboxylate transporter receptor subunit TctC